MRILACSVIIGVDSSRALTSAIFIIIIKFLKLKSHYMVVGEHKVYIQVVCYSEIGGFKFIAE